MKSEQNEEENLNTSIKQYKKRITKKEIIYIFLIFLIINVTLFILLNIKIDKLKLHIIHLNNSILYLSKTEKTQNDSSKDLKQQVFNEKIRQNYISSQRKFCKNQNFINNLIIENKIKKVKINLLNITFDMFVYKNKDIVSNSISKRKSWDSFGTKNIIKCLDYFSKKTKTPKNDIFILDIGANIGWYSLFLGRLGYNIIAFEPSKKNYFIFRKNYCLNQDINVTIINKGIYTEDKNCILYHPLSNIGNAILFCDKHEFNDNNYKSEMIELTKFSNYISYLEDKNLALIKLDVEGAEGKAIESGIDIITKYHIPFIYMELSPRELEEKGTDPRLFLEMFEKNGYKFSKKDFLSNDFLTIDKLLKLRQINIYIVYSNFLD